MGTTLLRCSGPMACRRDELPLALGLLGLPRRLATRKGWRSTENASAQQASRRPQITEVASISSNPIGAVGSSTKQSRRWRRAPRWPSYRCRCGPSPRGQQRRRFPPCLHSGRRSPCTPKTHRRNSEEQSSNVSRSCKGWGFAAALLALPAPVWRSWRRKCRRDAGLTDGRQRRLRRGSHAIPAKC